MSTFTCFFFYFIKREAATSPAQMNWKTVVVTNKPKENPSLKRKLPGTADNQTVSMLSCACTPQTMTAAMPSTPPSSHSAITAAE